MRLTGFHEVDRALGRSAERRLVDLEGRYLAAQHRIVQPALPIAANGIGGDLAERPADAAIGNDGA